MKKLVVLLLSLGLLIVACSNEDQAEPQDSGISNPELEQKARIFVSRMAAGQYDSATVIFDSALTADFKPEGIAEVWQSLTGQFGAYLGQLGVTGDTVKGYDLVNVTMKFEKLPIDAQLAFDSTQHLAGLHFAPTPPPEYTIPEYVDEDDFTETDVTFGEPDWLLPGIITLPKGDGPFPGIVLVHGSGPNDRDESLASMKPFKDIAQGLASRGIAVIRYDKRTLIHGQRFQNDTDYTVQQEVIDDAYLAWAKLASQETVDRGKVFFLGHSLGGMLLPRMAKNFDKPAGYVMLAGATRPIEDILVQQISYIYNLDGILDEQEQAALADLQTRAAMAKHPELKLSSSAQSLPLGIRPSYWLDLRGYLPHQVARSINKPMLILQGERDYQVTMEDFNNWKTALADKPNATLKSYPDLNHLFVEGEGMAVPDEYFKSGHVAKKVIEDIANWIKEQ